MKTPRVCCFLFLAVTLPLAGAAFAQTASPSASPAATAPPTTTVPSVPSPAAQPAKVPKEILDKYDTNHNGVLDPSEQAALDKDRAIRRAERLQKYDKNHDGKLDDSERAAMRADRDAARQKAGAAKATASPTP